MSNPFRIPIVGLYPSIGSNADSASNISLANQVFTHGLVALPQADLDRWKEYLGLLGATAADAWRLALISRAIPNVPTEAACSCGRHVTLALAGEDAKVSNKCSHAPRNATELLADQIWKDSALASRKHLRSDETFPDSWTSRFSFLTRNSSSITVVDPYLAKNLHSSLERSSDGYYSTLRLILDDVGPQWTGTIRIAVKNHGRINGATPGEFIEQQINLYQPARKFSYEIAVTSRNSKVLHDRAIGFKVGNALLDFEIGKGLQIFSDPPSRPRSTCTLTESGLAAAMYADASGERSVKVVSG